MKLLGTPTPPADVAVGDQVVCQVEEVGVLRNHIIGETPGQ